MNDSHVSSSSLKSVLNKQAYVLFYSKIQQVSDIPNGTAMKSQLSVSTSLEHCKKNVLQLPVASTLTSSLEKKSDALTRSDIIHNAKQSSTTSSSKTENSRIIDEDIGSTLVSTVVKVNIVNTINSNNALKENVKGCEVVLPKSRGLKLICSWKVKPYR